MVEGLNIIEQFTIVNAPAGSGKTTSVSKNIKKLLSNSKKKILCITYTNKAAEQLSERIDDERVNIGTIHSFIGNFMSPFFKIKPIVEYFLEYYDEHILEILEGTDEKDVARLERYLERYNLPKDFQVTKETIAKNISHLEYGETQFTSFLHGRLSHDDLLVFSKAVFKKFPKLNKAISHQYSYIFIDEYQDTKSDILELFYNATLQSDTKLTLLGDEMQQIYQDRVEDFQQIINRSFVRDYSLKNNWRSQGNIVSLLNNLYYDSSYKQNPQKPAQKKPKIHIVEDLTNIQTDALQLVLHNSELFKAIGSYNLYDAYNKRYKLYDKYRSKDILFDLTSNNPDDLMALLIFILEITDLFDNKQFGHLIQKIINFKFSNKEIWKIKSHLDKVKVSQHLEGLSKEIKKEITIEELLNFLSASEIVDTSYIGTIINNIDDDLEFKNKINSVKFSEFINCYREIKNPKFSTQHAVKGEGYDHVALKVSDGTNNPNVKMYLFLEMLSKDLFNYQDLCSINVVVVNNIKNFTDSVGKKVSKLNASDYKQYKHQCSLCIINIKKALIVNKSLYEEFFAKDIISFEEKLNISTFKKCITAVNRIEGVLLAYKLFYVGCSRAKKKLDVYVTQKNIQGFKKEFISKMKEIKFEVEVH
ncbi:UvrD-helicase domain-containing protein [Priestia endophytica]|uniref:UvrD-helicase domain-containing protein n=1 Tax=Priestia endophytica TaxID=135735 RepID=UPI00155909FA|nr:UvrD-helicase domain-containing protein [Priestia endophytica]